MVFTTVVNFVRSRGPDEFWRKRKIFKLAAVFSDRVRPAFSSHIFFCRPSGEEAEIVTAFLSEPSTGH
jgi:hypothetical protein